MSASFRCSISEPDNDAEVAASGGRDSGAERERLAASPDGDASREAQRPGLVGRKAREELLKRLASD